LNACLIANPAAHGIVLEPIPNEPYFATVDRAHDIDVKLAAKLAEIPVADFVALNPGFSRPLIRSTGGSRIVLPADKVETFHENLEKHEDRSLVSWKTYTPGRGDTLEGIARQHGLTLGQLREVNGIHPRTRQVPKLLVVPFQREPNDSALAVVLSDNIRNRVRGAHLTRFNPILKEGMCRTLTESGFPCDMPLDANSIRHLARFLNARLIIEGNVIPRGQDSVLIIARLVEASGATPQSATATMTVVRSRAGSMRHRVTRQVRARSASTIEHSTPTASLTSRLTTQ